MSLALPDWPSPAKMTVRLVSARATLNPVFGGDVQRLNRMGSRYALDVEMPGMTYVQAMAWSDVNDEDGTVTMLLVQPGFDTGAPGSPAVAGASQSGSVLNVDGVTPHYVFRKDQWISITTSGRHYAYRLKSEVVADAAGVAALPLRTMLRVSPADNDLVEVSEPRIEGFATVSDDTWSVDTSGLVYLSFTIEERG